MSSNFEKHCGSPEKLACCIIEHALEEEMLRHRDEILRVSTTYDGKYEELGLFFGSWEFEEWLWSDLPYEEWRAQRGDASEPLSKS